MNEHEKYLFDLNGYLVVENVLTPDEVALCNEAIDRHADDIRERVGELSLSGVPTPWKASPDAVTSEGCWVGKNRGANRSVICLPTRKLCRIFTVFWGEGSVWITIPA